METVKETIIKTVVTNITTTETTVIEKKEDGTEDLRANLSRLATLKHIGRKL